MPTIDISTSPYNAVGDTQTMLLTCTMSLTGGLLRRLTVTGGTPFVIGDIGKTFGMGYYAGTSNLNANGFDGPNYVTTIANVISSTVIDLADTCPTAVGGVEQYVTWGTDASDAFTLFTTTNAGTPGVTLFIPPGNYLFANTGSGNVIPQGFTDLVVSGYGATLTGGGYGFGGFAFTASVDTRPVGIASRSVGSAFLTQNVAAGATAIFVSAADSNIFIDGQIAYLLAIDTQGYGEPQNPGYFEHVTITTINHGTGQINLAAPLTNPYKTTWPLYDPGGVGIARPNLGGPGTLYTNGWAAGPGLTIDYSWEGSVTLMGMTFVTGGVQVGGRFESITYIDCTAEGGQCVPSNNLNYTAIGCTFTQQMEIDKIVGTATFQNCTLRQPHVQSASVNDLVVADSVITSAYNGTALNTTTLRSTIYAGAGIGCTGYGVARTFTARDSYIGSLAPSGVFQSYTYGVDCTITATQIILAYAGGVPRWAVPGAWGFVRGGILSFECIFYINDMLGISPAVLDVTWPFGLPINVMTGSFSGITAHCCPNLTMTNCDVPLWNATISYNVNAQTKGSDGAYYWSGIASNLGNDPISSSASTWFRFGSSTSVHASLTCATEVNSACQALAQGKPFGSYSKRVYDGGTFKYNGGTVNPVMYCNYWIGRVQRVTVEVIRPATGGSADLSPVYDPFTAFGTWDAIDPTFTSRIGSPTGIFNQIDLRVAGVRTFTPTTTSGQTGDVLGINNGGQGIPGAVWFGGLVCGSINTTVISGQVATTWPIWSVEFIGDQGITPAHQVRSIEIHGGTFRGY